MIGLISSLGGVTIRTFFGRAPVFVLGFVASVCTVSTGVTGCTCTGDGSFNCCCNLASISWSFVSLVCNGGVFARNVSTAPCITDSTMDVDIKSTADISVCTGGGVFITSVFVTVGADDFNSVSLEIVSCNVRPVAVRSKLICTSWFSKASSWLSDKSVPDCIVFATSTSVETSVSFSSFFVFVVRAERDRFLRRFVLLCSCSGDEDFLLSATSESPLERKGISTEVFVRAMYVGSSFTLRSAIDKGFMYFVPVRFADELVGLLNVFVFVPAIVFVFVASL